MSNTKELINSIRRTQYLMDVNLPHEFAEGAQNIRETLNRTLKLLSEDLYSKDTHFALELVQNADDNSYPNGCLPEISFTLSPSEITVANNEQGFSLENVRALCGAGKSTKAKKEGYIGEKGIGFKSVFAVTHRPEVHSNGFHFRFDVSEENLLGYVVPEWIEECAEEPGTKIVLPVKPGQSFSPDILTELSSTLLLFLRKLRRLRLHDTQSATEHLTQRCDDFPYVELSRTVTSHDLATAPEITRYLLVSHIFSTVEVRDEKRPNSVKTQVELAFPVDADGAALASVTQPVFAFLPIRDVGFTFLVQGDFLLSSSREDIHQERPWNLLIRDQISQAFVAALPRFQELPQLSYTFLAYVPDPENLTDQFFRVAAEQIVTRLKQCDCLPVHSGEWRKPDHILFADRQFRELFSSEDILEDLGLEYASGNLPSALKPVALRLGANEPTLQHLFQLLQNKTRLIAHSTEWFSKLYRYLAPRLSRDTLVKRARGLALVRLENGSLTSVAEGSVFFPLELKRRYGFEDELRLVDPQIFSGSDAEDSEIIRLLRALGVQQASPAALIRDHVLPRHAAEDWKNSNFDALSGHVRYIKDHLDEFIASATADGHTRTQAIEQLRTGLWIRTMNVVNSSVTFRRSDILYLCDAYQPDVRMQEMLGPTADPRSFVSHTYLPDTKRSVGEKQRAGILSDWRTFFYTIGVNPIPTIIKNGLTHDFEMGAELATLLGAPTTLVAAIRCIDRYWSSYYQGYASVGGYGRTSAFITSLRLVLAPTKQRRNVRLCETFLGTQQVHAVFGHTAHYLDIELTDKNFMDAVGITHQVDAGACFKRLDQLRERQTISSREVRGLYRALESLSGDMDTSIQEGFGEDPRIYIPSTNMWLTTGDVVWEPHGELLDALYPPLSHAYSEHRTFFCEVLSVAQHPSPEILLRALESIPERIPDLQRQQHEASHIYRRLCVAMREHKEFDPTGSLDWLQRLRTEALFIDHAGRLVHADNTLFINDEPELSNSFRKYATISFLEIELSRISTIEPLLVACGIARLSAAVSYHLDAVVEPIPDLKLSRQLQRRQTAIMRLVFHRAHGIFEDAKEAGHWSTFSRLVVCKVASMSVVAHLLDYSAAHQRDFFRQEESIYIQRSTRSARDKICLALCSLIGLPADWADSIYRVAFAETDDEVEDFLQIKGAPVIPPDDIEPLISTSNITTWTEEAGEEPLADDVLSPEDTEFTPPSTDPFESLPTLSITKGRAPTEFGVTTNTGVPILTYKSTYRPDHPTRDSKRSGRLLSYVEPNSNETSTDQEHERDTGVELRQIADAAVTYVLERERAEGHQVIGMDFANEGFDILRTVANSADEYIEVKGLAGRWTEAGIALTPAELRLAERYRARYFLYIVEFATEPARRALYRIGDPFGKTKHFRFDSGWKGMSKPDEITEPVVGMLVDLPSGTALIQEVQRRGLFFNIAVQTALGAHTQILFIPGKMRLHRE